MRSARSQPDAPNALACWPGVQRSATTTHNQHRVPCHARHMCSGRSQHTSQSSPHPPFSLSNRWAPGSVSHRAAPPNPPNPPALQRPRLAQYEELTAFHSEDFIDMLRDTTPEMQAHGVGWGRTWPCCGPHWPCCVAWCPRPRCAHWMVGVAALMLAWGLGRSGMARAAERACMCWWPHRGLHPRAQCSTSFWAVCAPHPLVWCAVPTQKAKWDSYLKWGIEYDCPIFYGLFKFCRQYAAASIGAQDGTSLGGWWCASWVGVGPASRCSRQQRCVRRLG